MVAADAGAMEIQWWEEKALKREESCAAEHDQSHRVLRNWLG